MLIVQTADHPANLRHALVDLLKGENITDVQIASAYVTASGSEIILQGLKAVMTSKQFDTAPKTLVTSFDYGLTEPNALSLWSKLPNALVQVAGCEALLKGSLQPAEAFHPKIYAFGTGPKKCNLLVGSGNMTVRGFTVNTEVAWTQHQVAKVTVDHAFKKIFHGTTPLSDELLSQYKALRKKSPPSPQIALEIKPVPAPRPVAIASLSPFRDAVEDGALKPEQFEQMWVQCDKPQGGSSNQIELARGSHRFFGFTFSNYDFPDKTTIGEPVLRSGRKTWTDRLMTWHGNNKMERINLPTLAQGGYIYANSGIMFRRLSDDSYELIVVPWNSDLSRSWQEASAKKDLLFGVGSGKSARLIGLI
jgi:HKD family nuclease